MFEFKSADHFTINGHRGFYVENIRECHDFRWLIGEIVKIDDVKCKVTEVSRYPHSPPWKKGEEIKLMVNFLNDNSQTSNS